MVFLLLHISLSHLVFCSDQSVSSRSSKGKESGQFSGKRASEGGGAALQFKFEIPSISSSRARSGRSSRGGSLETEGPPREIRRRERGPNRCHEK